MAFLVALNANICFLSPVRLLQAQEICFLLAFLLLARIVECLKREKSHNFRVYFSVPSFSLDLDISSLAALGILWCLWTALCVLYTYSNLCPFSLWAWLKSWLPWVCFYAFKSLFLFLNSIIIFLGSWWKGLSDTYI